MTTPAKLDQITDFPSLVDYLRDELEWEIPEDAAFNDLTFSWTPSEVGLELNEPIEITQLRPLRADQPWGIFFLNFPQGNLPVTLMRRILRGLSKRQRASANAGDKAAWNKDDLLFISAVGAADDRRLSFAHFQDRGKDLPALRVIGWDHDDTVRRLSHVDRLLHQKLAWPDRGVLAEAWRDQWRSAFTERPRESVRTAKAMAEALAALARDIRDRIRLILPKEKPGGDLRKLFEAVKETLSKDLDTAKFADTYAQTIAYGLLSARINQVRERDAKHEQAQSVQLGPKTELPQITADAAGKAMPTTNPFLRELFGSFLSAGGRDGEGSGLDFDELGVSEVVDLLNAADMEAVLLDFDKHKAGDDPVIHFYEGFLHAYDKTLRVKRGVFYTPRPVVSFIVRSVDEVLRTEFDLEDGLADTTTWAEFVAKHPETKIPDGVKGEEPFVKILDPATGTGTFLVEVIELIHDRLVAKWKNAGLSEEVRLKCWNAWVPRHLLPRLYGFELMMAPYAVAHMKVGLKLADTGYRFDGLDADGKPARARVFLTNALEAPIDLSIHLSFMSEALAHEAKAANAAKAEERFTVILGNPPYSNFGKLNRESFIKELLATYKDGLNEKKLNLDDDYIKFIRLAQHCIDNTGAGCVGYITNSSFLDGIIHRVMRGSLSASFGKIRIVDLHGSSRRNEFAPGNEIDENVFDIQQGVAISILSKTNEPIKQATYFDLWGNRESKASFLSKNSTETLSCQTNLPTPPKFYYSRASEAGVSAEYNEYWPLDRIFSVFSTGMTAERDRIGIQFSKAEMVETVRDFRAGDVAAIKSKYELEADSRDWQLSRAIADVRYHTNDNELIQKILYRPFDFRKTWYSASSRGFVGTPVPLTGLHLVGGENLALLATRQTKEKVGALVVDSLAGHKSFSGYDRTYVFPLKLRVSALGDPTTQGLISNFSEQFTIFSKSYWEKGGKGVPVDEDILKVIYSILYSPTYRERYADFLKSDFARIPLPRERALFADLIPLGAELVALHLLDASGAPILSDPKVRFVNPGNVEARLDGRQIATRRNSAGRVYLNEGCWFETIPETVWNHWIGGYQPAQKWLKDRAATSGAKAKPGRVLTPEDQLHYRRMIVALGRTTELMAEIDGVITKHGGWPDAFRGMTE